jgi:Transmembrane secretion effector
VGVQMVTPTGVRARALAAYLRVFQGTMAVGSFAWGTLWDVTQTELTLKDSSAP